MVFRKGDIVRLNERGRRRARYPYRVGTYVNTTRDGGDRVYWGGTTRPQSISSGFLELAPKELPMLKEE